MRKEGNVSLDETKEKLEADLSKKIKDSRDSGNGSSADGGEEMHQFVVFKLDRQEYALDVLSVQEIVGYTRITPVPGSEEYMRGLMNLRGNILHVVDLRTRLAMEQEDEIADDETVIVVINTGTRKFGIVVDLVSDVVMVPVSSISEPPEIHDESGMLEMLVSNVIRYDERIIMVLKVDDIV
jgi:purine-binding chemotaxis protein CheW